MQIIPDLRRRSRLYYLMKVLIRFHRKLLHRPGMAFVYIYIYIYIYTLSWGRFWLPHEQILFAACKTVRATTHQVAGRHSYAET